MQKLIRTTLFAAILLAFGASMASAQTYEIEADSMDLAPSNDTTNVQCLTQLQSGTFVFFNSNAEGIYTWDGSSLGEHRSAQDLNNDVPDESNNFDSCDGAVAEAGFVYFILRSSATNDNYVYRTEAADPSNNSFVQFNGANGLATDGSTVYIAAYQFFGAPEDGIWEVGADLSGSPSELAANADLSIDVIDLTDDGILYGFSNSFGGGNFESNIFSIDVTASSPSFSVFTDPYGSGTPFNDTGDQIEDLEVIDFDGTEYIVVYNQSFDGPNGEEWGTIKTSDQSTTLLFTQGDLASGLSVPGYTGGGTEPMVVTSSGDVFAASRFRTSSGQVESTDYIAKVSDAPPLPVEMAGFDAVQNGSSVELRWQTASETNNAGFRVQQATESGWTTLGFVESKAAGGTTTEAQSYRYTVKQELAPGTHRFRLKQEDLDGSTSLSDVVKLDVSMDEALSLSAPAPNPAHGQTTLSFGVKQSSETTIGLYNVLGQQVKTLYRGTPQPDQLTKVDFDVSTLPSGMYFVRMQADGQTQTQRLTVVQ